MVEDLIVDFAKLGIPFRYFHVFVIVGLFLVRGVVLEVGNDFCQDNAGDFGVFGKRNGL